MNKDDILKMAQNPNYIEGIYNYCDRWCERCPLTSRCLNYALAEKKFGNVSAQDLGNKEFWENLKEMFQLTIDMLIEWADQHGIDLNNIDMDAMVEQEQRHRVDAENHELSRAAHKYGEIVDQWFELEQPLFRELQEELNAIVEFGIGGNEPYEEAENINDAVEVIRWYQHQIYVKLIRALTQRESDADAEEDEDQILQQDADGSVKVALIGLDRSIGAWGALRKHFPERGDDLIDILLHLDRLRRKAEQYFPNARSFMRPGFDTIEGLA